MCGGRGREIRSESRRRLGREGATLLPNEGSALVELKMDVEERLTKTEYYIFPLPLWCEYCSLFEFSVQ